jgi:hypothetical protein
LGREILLANPEPSAYGTKNDMTGTPQLSTYAATHGRAARSNAPSSAFAIGKQRLLGASNWANVKKKRHPMREIRRPSPSSTGNLSADIVCAWGLFCPISRDERPDSALVINLFN